MGLMNMGPLGVPQTLKSCDALIKTFRFILRYVNLFVKVSRVFAVSSQFFVENSNCSNSLDLRNLQEQVKKAFCYQTLF